MKNKKLIDILKTDNIVIPMYIYNIIKKYDFNLDEFMTLMYLYNKGDKYIFDPNAIATNLNIELGKVMEIISKLTDSKLITLEVEKNDKGVMEEYVSLEQLYGKVSLVMIEEFNKKEEDDNIYSLIEKEFGRTLSPIEYEIVKAWLEQDTPIDLIKEALKEATFNGVSNLRYIDKILYEWSKKGFKTTQDVEKNRTQFKDKKNEKVEVFDYNWLEDDE